MENKNNNPLRMMVGLNLHAASHKLEQLLLCVAEHRTGEGAQGGRREICDLQLQVVSLLSVLAQPSHRCQRTSTCPAQASKKWLFFRLHLHLWAGFMLLIVKPVCVLVPKGTLWSFALHVVPPVLEGWHCTAET